MLFGLVVALAPAFSSPSAFRCAGRSSTLQQSSGRFSALQMSTLRISGSGDLEVTEPMREYAEQKLFKPLDIHADVLNVAQAVELHLKVEHRGLHDSEHKGREAHIAKVEVSCKDKALIVAESETESMYASLDELADMLSRKLRKHKEKRVDLKENRKRTDKERIAVAALADEEDEEGGDALGLM